MALFLYNGFILNKKIPISIWIYPALFLLLCCLIPSSNFDGKAWTDWSKYLLKEPFWKIYRSGANYPPLYLYVLWVYTKICGGIKEIGINLINLKRFTLIFDFLLAIVPIWILLKKGWKKKNYFLLPIIFLFNIGYLYDTVVWGQIDAIYVFWIVLSIVFLIKKQGIFAWLFFLIAINFKFQAIIFLPLLILISFLVMDFDKALKTIILLIMAQTIILFPFIMHGNVMEVINGVWKQSINLFPIISASAHNWWILVLNNTNGNDGAIYKFGLSYNKFGYLLFSGSLLVILFPLIKILFMKRQRKIIINWKKFTEQIFLLAGLLNLIFFYFNTQMHERYSYPSIVFFGLYGIWSGNYFLYILVSLISFLNMEKIIRFLKLNYSSIIFNERYISILFLGIIIFGTYILYKNRKKNYTLARQ